MKRFLLIFTGLVCTVFLAAGLLAFTQKGNSWLWRQLCNQLPQLHGEMISGTLLHGWTFKNLQWRDESFDFRADRVVLQWQLDQILGRHLTVTRLEIHQPVITLSETETPDETSQEDSPGTGFAVPIELDLKELLVSQLQFVSREVEINLDQLKTDLRLKTRQLLVDKVLADKLKIKLPETAESSSAQSEEIQLPDITLPLPVRIRELKLSNALFEQGDIQATITQVDLALEAEQDQLQLSDLKLVSPWADLSAEGSVRLNNDYPLSLKAQIDIHKHPLQEFLVQNRAQLELSGSLKKLDITLENHGTLDGILQGFIEPLSPNLPFDLSLSWAPLQWPASSQLKELPVQAGTLSAQGSLQHFRLKLSTSLQLKEQLSTQVALAAEGNIDQLAINRLSVKAGRNQLTASGELRKNWTINAELNAPDLGELYPGLEGSLYSQFNFRGDFGTAEGSYQIDSPALNFGQFSLVNLESSGQLSRDKIMGGDIALTLDTLSTGSVQLQQVSFSLTGNEHSHTAQFKAEGQPLAGAMTVHGSWKSNLWTGSTAQAEIQTPVGNWSLAETMEITVNDLLQASLSPHCWQSGKASLCIRPSLLSTAHIQSEFALTGFSPEQFSSYLPPALQWQARLTAEGSVLWKQGQPPQLNLKANSSPGNLVLDNIQSEYETLDMSFNLTPDKLDGTLRFFSRELGTISMNFAVDEPQQKRLLSGQFSIDRLLLNSFAPLIPEVSALDGLVSANGKLAGNLDKPLIYGELVLENGSLETDSDFARIRELSSKVSLKGDRGVISGHLMVGEGRLNVGGDLSWSQLPPTGKITLSGEELEVKYPGIATAKVSPDLVLTFGQATELKGRLSIPYSRIRIKSLPENAVDVSDDVKVTIKGVPVSPEARKAPFNIDLALTIGDDNELDAFGLRTGLTGRLNLKQETDRPLEAHGEVQLKEGRYHYLGQDLLIREGKIIFSGPVDRPFLVINAIRNPDAIEDRVTVGIRVSGTLQRPDWEVYSNPDMPQQEQLSYLLRGSGLKGGDSGGLQAILLGLGVNQLGGIAASIGDTIGVSDLTLETEGRGDDTRVTVGGYIAPGLRIQYGAGVFRSVSDIKVRYEIIPRLYLQAVSGLAQAVDIFYRFSL
ncbi:MAG: translocation/assembly module TamB domain-containing protein [Endozoicomonas sp.]